MLAVYEKLVPNIYVPEPGVMMEVLKQVDLNGAVEYVPKLWSDMTIFDHTGRENLIKSILKVMTNNGTDIESELREIFSCIAWDIYEKISKQNENRSNNIT